jgi:hypothetical protein
MRKAYRLSKWKKCRKCNTDFQGYKADVCYDCQLAEREKRYRKKGKNKNSNT